MSSMHRPPRLLTGGFLVRVQAEEPLSQTFQRLRFFSNIPGEIPEDWWHPLPSGPGEARSFHRGVDFCPPGPDAVVDQLEARLTGCTCNRAPSAALLPNDSKLESGGALRRQPLTRGRTPRYASREATLA